MELAVVLDVARPLRQHVHARAEGPRAVGQALRRPDLGQQLQLDRFRRDAVGAGVVVHLLQVRPVAEPPRLRQRRGTAVRRQVAAELVLVQEPRQLRPAAQALLQLDAVGTRRAQQPGQIPRVRLLADRLRAEEHRADRLLHLAAPQSGLLVLDGPRLGQLALQDRGPVVPAALGQLARGDAGQLAGRLGDPRPVRRRQEHVGTDQGRGVPGLGVPQRDRERPQDAARPLEPVELRPARVEEIGQIGVEGIPAGEALLGVPAVLAHDVVHGGEVAHGRRHVRQEGVRVRDRRGREEASTQHLGHILLLNGLDPFLLLSIEDLADLRADRLAGVVALVQVRGEQRRHERATVDLRHRLAQILEEVGQPAAPGLVHGDLAAREHQHLIDQHQRRQPLGLGPRQQIDQQRFRGSRLALLVLTFSVQRPDPGSAGDLEGEHAPRMLQPAQLAPRPAYLHPLLDVQLVEGQRRDPGPAATQRRRRT